MMELYAMKSWFDKHHGVVELQDDVQSIVRQVKELDPNLHVFFNEQSGGYDIVETCLDHTDRLVFSVAELDGRVIHRLHRADHWLDGNPEHVLDDEHDFAAQIDRSNEAWERGVRGGQLDMLRDAGERLARALGEDGKGSSILVPRSF